MLDTILYTMYIFEDVVSEIMIRMYCYQMDCDLDMYMYT